MNIGTENLKLCKNIITNRQNGFFKEFIKLIIIQIIKIVGNFQKTNKMKKDIFEKDFTDKLNQNFNKQSKYFDFKLKVFYELSPIIFEINKCLLLDLNKASITLTNNLLERLLKLALVYNETGIDSKPVENWDSDFSKPNSDYGSMQLGNTIEKCKKFNLLNQSEKVYLFDIVRELMRNGFSYADTNKILSDLPDSLKMFEINLSNSNEIKEVNIKHKVIPFLQAIQIESFAKENANHYFDYVFNLIFRIELRLIDKNK